jgi:hypothetical protein
VTITGFFLPAFFRFWFPFLVAASIAASGCRFATPGTFPYTDPCGAKID